MLKQEFLRIIKTNLFVKNDIQIISISSKTSSSQQLETLRKLIISLSAESESQTNSEFIEDKNLGFEKSFKNALENSTEKNLIFGDLTFELGFGYFDGIGCRKRLLQLRTFSEENSKLSKTIF